MKSQASAYASMNFLCARQQVISLRPVSSSSVMGYVWRRVFLKGTRSRIR
jgi:hypothetical protein